MLNILLWGAGVRTKNYLQFHYFEKCNILGIVDTFSEQSEWMGYPIYKPDALPNLMKTADYLIICNQFFMEIYRQCMDLGIEQSKILLTDFVPNFIIEQDWSIIKGISYKLFDTICQRSLVLSMKNIKDEFDQEKIVGTGDFASFRYTKDYYRYRTFEFMANQIIENGVQGAVAELGVFQGVFSALINKKFSDRDLYLFDTFEGFDVEENAKEAAQGHSDEDFAYTFKQTSLDIVLCRMPHPEKCHVQKGLFPQTVTKEIAEQKFAFVSLDVDFEDSTYAGLDFFYPRLSPGGVIFLHDYNSLFLLGVKKAVERYEKDHQLKLQTVPLADQGGTLIILKAMQ